MKKLFSRKLISSKYCILKILDNIWFYILENTYEGFKVLLRFYSKELFHIYEIFWYVNIKWSYCLRILNPIINGINLIKKHKRLLAALFVSANYRQGQVEWQQLSSWKKKRNTRVTSAQAARCSRSACVANGPP